MGVFFFTFIVHLSSSRDDDATIVEDDDASGKIARFGRSPVPFRRRTSCPESTEGYERKTKSKKRNAFLAGGLLGTALWIAVYAAAASGDDY